MTIKAHVRVDPVDETVRVTVKGQRTVVGEKEPKQTYYQQFETPTTLQSSEIPLEVGDKIQVTIEAAKSIVLDNEQFVVRLEDPDTGEIKKEREAEAEAEKKTLEEHKEDQKKRAENAKKLETKFKKEADETEVPSKAPPFPAPLELEDEHENKTASARVPPKGGARDSHDVKGG